MDLVVKKCLKCGAVIIPFKDCNCDNCGIKCCGEEMKILEAKSDLENHIPTYEVVEDEICVKVNHVMEKDHYIEFIVLVTNDKTYIEKLYPEMDAIVRFKYIKGAYLYSYCNKDGLYKSEIVK